MSNASFLPEDYVTQAAERRTNLASMVLFGIVMTAVFGAFLVTNRQWTQVRHEQLRINDETEKAAADIRKMQELEDKRGQMIEKAELAMMLIEPVPRSTLLALLVNAMPERLSLLEFDLRSEEVKKPRRKPEEKKDSKPTPQAAKVASRGKTKSEAEKAKDEAPKPEPVRYIIALSMTGVAPTDLDVSRFMNALGDISILKGVRLETTEEKEVDGLLLRQFRISCRIDTDADLRAVKANGVQRPANPMTDTMRIAPPRLRTNAENAHGIPEDVIPPRDDVPAFAPETEKEGNP